MRQYIKTLFGFVVAAGTMVPVASGQTLTMSQRRDFSRKALELIDSYRRLSEMSGAEEAREFGKLFADDKAVIFNDLPGLSAKPEMTVAEYTSLLNSGINAPAANIKSIRRGKPVYKDGKWTMDITFDKDIRYVTRCGAVMETEQYFGDDFHCVATVVYDPSTGKCAISSITGSTSSDVPMLGPDHTVVKKHKPFRQTVSANGTPLRFDTYGQAFVNGTPASLRFTTDAPDTRVKVYGNLENRECGNLEINAHPMRFRVRPYVGIGVGDAFSFDNLYSNPEEISQSETEFGVDFGYSIPLSRSFKLNLFVGAAYSTSKLDVSLSSYDYSYQAGADADMDGDTYVRTYNLTDIEDNRKFSSLVIPVSFDFEYSFSRRVSAFARVGAKVYLNSLSSTHDFNASAFIYGTYPQYDNLVIDADWMNGFGSRHIGTSDLVSPELKSVTVDGMAGLGVRIGIVGPLALEVGASYQMGFMNLIDAVDSPAGPVTYTVAGGEKTCGLISMDRAVKRQGLKINAGLVFKF